MAVLNCLDVADPALPETETGLDRPVEFALKTHDGTTYTVRIGKKTEEGAAFARISVTGQSATPDPYAPLARWTFLLDSYAADSMSLGQDQLVRPKPPPADPHGHDHH
jgi:hypothetical protein